MQLLQLFDLPSLLFSSSALIGGGIAGNRNMTKSILIAKDLAIPVGIIGTLIGFVNMLSSLDDPSALGPAIGVALLSTDTIYFLVKHSRHIITVDRFLCRNRSSWFFLFLCRFYIFVVRGIVGMYTDIF